MHITLFPNSTSVVSPLTAAKAALALSPPRDRVLSFFIALLLWFANQPVASADESPSGSAVGIRKSLQLLPGIVKL